MNSDIYGNYNYVRRIKFTNEGDLSFDFLKSKNNYHISIIDQNGLPIFTSSNLMEIPKKLVKINPGIYQVKINSQNQLDNFQLNFKVKNYKKNLKNTQFNIQNLKIYYDKSNKRALERLMSLAKKNARDKGSQVITNMPEGRIKATLLDSKNNSLKANLGLSGRSIQHFNREYPSVDIRILGGETFNGLSSFRF